MHVFRLPHQGVAPFVGVQVLGRDVSRRDQLPAERLDGLKDEAEEVNAAGVIRVEALRVPGVAFELPLHALAVVPGPEGHPALLDDLVHPGGQLQLGLLADVGAADDEPDPVGAVEADAHVRLELRAALPEQERRLVVVVPREVDGAAHLPAVGLQGPDQGRDEVPGLHGVVAVGPPRAAAELEFGRAVVLLLLVHLEVPELVGALPDHRHQVGWHVKHPETVVPGEDDGTVAVLVQLQVRAPLVEEGVRGAAEVDVGGESPLVLCQDPGQLQNDEPGLNGGFAGVEHGLVPGRPGQLEGDDDADASVVVGQGLLGFDPGTPSQVDYLEGKKFIVLTRVLHSTGSILASFTEAPGSNSSIPKKLQWKNN